jgi:hypothetical protein
MIQRRLAALRRFWFDAVSRTGPPGDLTAGEGHECDCGGSVGGGHSWWVNLESPRRRRPAFFSPLK